MRATLSTGRRAWALALATTAVLAAGVIEAPEAGARGGFRAELLRIVNETRVGRGLSRVTLDVALSRDSRIHTRRMIRDNRIYDPPNLDEILSHYRWDDIGADVVGCGNTLRELHRILMSHGFHRRIILHEDLRRVGIGVVRADENNRCGRNSFWATEIFYG
jgi:uncharacterized protein YkwD